MNIRLQEQEKEEEMQFQTVQQKQPCLRSLNSNMDSLCHNHHTQGKKIM